MNTIGQQLQSSDKISIDPDRAKGIIAHNKKRAKCTNYHKSLEETTACHIKYSQKTLTIINKRVKECTLPYSEIFTVKNKARIKRQIQGKTITLICGSQYRINNIRDILFNGESIVLICNSRRGQRYFPIYLSKKSIKKIE